MERRYRIAGTLASLALIAPLVGCAVNADPTLEERNAPAEAPYTVGLETDYSANVREAIGYAGNESQKEALRKLETVAVAQWLTGDNDAAAVRESLLSAKRTDSIPTFVLYNIPGRDIGNYSAGGSDSAQAYKTWVSSISRQIGVRPSVIVVEPDAVPHLSELQPDQAGERAELLAYALDTLHANTNTAVYLDVGNSAWRSADETGEILSRIKEKARFGIRGIALNVSNYRSSNESQAYAKAVEAAYGHDLYVMIDNSRNGTPDAVGRGDWCNPEGQTLGTVDPLFDPAAKVEFAYIKTPGESDGQCGTSDRPAGGFDGDLLLRQLPD